jgi:pimeloyl-ACP methyl ester carboxylesterase
MSQFNAPTNSHLQVDCAWSSLHSVTLEYFNLQLPQVDISLPSAMMMKSIKPGQCPFRPPSVRQFPIRHVNSKLTSPILKWRARSAELEEVDPMTGEIISGTSMASLAPSSIEAGGFTWAYRTADVNPKEATPDKLPVLCLHGIGSSSYAYRNVIRLLGAAGHTAMAMDFIGHGNSSKPHSNFDFSSESYIKSLNQAIEALPLGTPCVLIVHGYILGQIALLWAARNQDKVAKLVILNTPLSLKSKLRPELAAYKAPIAFMRPKPDAYFNAAYFNAAGGPYALQRKDADAYAAAYDDPAASAAIYRTMEAIDFNTLLSEVNEEYYSWKNPALMIHGGADSFLDLKLVLDWLETKRTCMQMATGIEAKVGHMPHEDFAEGITPAIIKFIQEI